MPTVIVVNDSGRQSQWKGVGTNPLYPGQNSKSPLIVMRRVSHPSHLSVLSNRNVGSRPLLPSPFDVVSSQVGPFAG